MHFSRKDKQGNEMCNALYEEIFYMIIIMSLALSARNIWNKCSSYSYQYVVVKIHAKNYVGIKLYHVDTEYIK